MTHRIKRLLSVLTGWSLLAALALPSACSPSGKAGEARSGDAKKASKAKVTATGPSPQKPAGAKAQASRGGAPGQDHGDDAPEEEIFANDEGAADADSASTDEEPKASLCAPPPSIDNPAEQTSYVARASSYAVGTANFNGFTSRINAAVYYPARSNDKQIPPPPGQTFPLVVLLHGNHDNVVMGGQLACESDLDAALRAGHAEIRSDLGLVYLASNLSAAGHVVISINANDLNCENGSLILERSQLILAHLDKLKNGSGFTLEMDAVRRQIDFSKVVLIGHSRGGEAVVHASLATPPTGITWGGVLSIAPTDNDGLVPTGLPYLTVVPAADGDLGTTPGIRLYDRAQKGQAGRSWFKAQQFVYGANHNFFNSEWNKTGLVNNVLKENGDDGLGNGEQRLSAEQQRSYLVSIARLFLAAVHGEEAGRSYFSQDLAVQGLENIMVWPSFTDSADYLSYTGELTAPGAEIFGEYSFDPQNNAPEPAYNDSFFHNQAGYVWGYRNQSTLHVPTEMAIEAGDVLSLRVGQLVDKTYNRTGEALILEVELKDVSGASVFTSSDKLGRKIPPPYLRPLWQNFDAATQVSKTLLGSVRIPAACFLEASSKVDFSRIASINIKVREARSVALAITDLQLLPAPPRP